jgi:hypothetical protein
LAVKARLPFAHSGTQLVPASERTTPMPVGPDPSITPHRATRRWAVRPGLALFFALLAVLTATTTAQAVTTTWRQSLATAKGTTSTGIITWDNSAFTEKLTVKTGTLATGKCVTVYFDWVSHTHNDARAVRNCQSNSTLTYTFTETDTSQLSGNVNKYGVCYALKDERGTCVGQGGIANDWTPWPDTTRTAPCDLSWVLRNANGTITKFLDPHPTSTALRSGGTC